jgi:ankyrin repeat protein
MDTSKKILDDYLEKLFVFCKFNDLDSLKKSIYTSISIDEKHSKFGWSLLSVSSYHHSIDVVKYLIENGANINSQNNNGTTVLMFAKSKVKDKENLYLLDYLIEKGADLYLKDNFGKDIFYYVNETGNLTLIDYFISLSKKY